MKHLLLACIMAVICLPASGGNNKKSKPGGASLKVLCLGNSITRHEYKADIEWFSEWGRDYERFGALHEYYMPDNGEPILNKGFQNWNLLVLNMAAWLDGKETVNEF